MGLVQEIAVVKVTSYNIEYYRSIGYDCEDGYDLSVKVEELSHGSGVPIDVQCDFCGRIFKKQYRRYRESIGKLACAQCKSKKAIETHLERYGSPCVLWNSEIRQKIIDNSMQKYGCENPGCSEIANKRRRETCMRKYGVPTPLEDEEIYLKTHRSCNGILEASTSKEQTKFHEYVRGEFNYNIGKYFIDDFLAEENLCCEYDGGGHDMRVKTGQITQEKFEQKEKNRNEFLVSLGYKVFRFCNPRSRSFSEEDVISQLDKARIAFDAGYNIYIYNHKNKSETIM